MNRSLIAVALSSLVFSGCFGSGNDADMPDVFAAKHAVRWTQGLAARDDISLGRSAPLIGPFAAAFLAMPDTMVRGAMNAVDTVFDLFVRKEVQQEEAFALLQELGSALSVQLFDVLNRSPDRAEALDTYVRTLGGLTADAQRRAVALDEEQDSLQDQQREVRNRVRDLEGDIRSATRDEDFATAGALQPSLNEQRKELANLEIEEDEVDELLDLYNDVLDVAVERLTAIQANRDAIIAGVTVTNIRGAEDLGVLQDAGRGLDEQLLRELGL